MPISPVSAVSPDSHPQIITTPNGLYGVGIFHSHVLECCPNASPDKIKSDLQCGEKSHEEGRMRRVS